MSENAMAMAGSATEELLALASNADRFDLPLHELRPKQIAAINERFQQLQSKIRLVALRAEEAGLEKVETANDVALLLLPHTAYKSYPEGWLREGRWDKLTRWLATTSTLPLTAIDLAGVTSMDEWMDRLRAAGAFMSCSSGTTGKPSMLAASQRDLDWVAAQVVNTVAWMAGKQPAQDFLMVSCAAMADTAKTNTTVAALRQAFGNPEWPALPYPVPPISIGVTSQTIMLRKAIADGTARPGEIADFERTAQERQEMADAAVSTVADYLIANREKKMMVSGVWSGLYPIMQAVRERGYSGDDFHPENAIYSGGGLKRVSLPDNFREFICETINIAPANRLLTYGMQELNSPFPRCTKGGRYHVPPWIVPFVMTKDGDAMVEETGAEMLEGRAGYFDLSMDGRWGGFITGDKITLFYSPCPCGHQGPTILDNVARYSDLEGDDKIACAGTIDTYVRGMA